jgi:hypothetical protein
MQFIKKNYEKILLGLVLAGLVVVSFFLLILVGNEKARLDDLRMKIITRRVEPLPPLDSAPVDTLLKRAGSTMSFDFTATNKLFNPISWAKTVDGRLIKMDAGNAVKGLEITNTTPLYLNLTLLSVTLSADSAPRYVIGIEQQAAPMPNKRTLRTAYASINEKKDMFTVRAAEGPVENPTNMVLELNETGERISLAKDRPFKRVEGYLADMKYDPEKKVFLKRRKDDSISFAGEDYKIVDIKQDEVVLSAKSNQKKWTIKFNAAP